MPETHPCLPTPTSDPSQRRSWFERLTQRFLNRHPAPARLVDPTVVHAASFTEQIRAAVLADYHQATGQLSREHTMALVRAGVHIGPTPYGYRRHVHYSARRDGRRDTLTPDLSAGPVVELIYHWQVHEHLGYSAITRRLAADPDWCPPPANSRSVVPGAWSVSAVRAILTNPVYTGRTVWGRTHYRRPVPPDQWILSAPGVHPRLVDDDTFVEVQRLLLRRTGPHFDYAHSPYGQDVG